MQLKEYIVMNLHDFLDAALLGTLAVLASLVLLWYVLPRPGWIFRLPNKLRKKKEARERLAARVAASHKEGWGEEVHIAPLQFPGHRSPWHL
jgi:hypothetical protein